mgnify:CR=1 FL=1
MIWNHVFLMYEVYRAAGVDWILFVLGFAVTVMSVTRHMYYEKRFFLTAEPLAAKGTVLYIVIASAGLPCGQMAALLASKGLIVLLYAVQNRDYERLHPWMHVLVAIDAHYYISCIARVH